MDYCKYGIRVNSIRMAFHTLPGAPLFGTSDVVDLQLLRRAGTPEDVARAALFLSSPMSGFITGECIPVNGGGDCIGHNQVWKSWLSRI